MLTIGLDADDTLWENEAFFHLTQDDFVRLLSDHAEAGTIRARLHDTQIRNLEIYGYGVMAFTLSMIQTALELTGNAVPGQTVARLLALGQEMLRHPGVLSGSTDEIAERIRGYRDVYGISYLIVQDRHAEAFGKVIELLQ